MVAGNEVIFVFQRRIDLWPPVRRKQGVGITKFLDCIVNDLQCSCFGDFYRTVKRGNQVGILQIIIAVRRFKIFHPPVIEDEGASIRQYQTPADMVRTVKTVKPLYLRLGDRLRSWQVELFGKI